MTIKTKKNKPKIRNIILSKEQQAKLDNTRLEYSKLRQLRKLFGVCCKCGILASKIVSYNANDSKQKARLIERYCQSCFEKRKK